MGNWRAEFAIRAFTEVGRIIRKAMSEMDSRFDEVDVLADIVRHRVGLAAYHISKSYTTYADSGAARTYLLVTRWMGVYVIFGVQQMFDLGGCSVDFDPPLVMRDADPVGIETRSDQPIFDFGNGVLAGGEVFDDALRGPVLAKGRRVWM